MHEVILEGPIADYLREEEQDDGGVEVLQAGEEEISKPVAAASSADHPRGDPLRAKLVHIIGQHEQRSARFCSWIPWFLRDFLVSVLSMLGMLEWSIVKLAECLGSELDLFLSLSTRLDHALARLAFQQRFLSSLDIRYADLLFLISK
jgi:hypothetical protein